MVSHDGKRTRRISSIECLCGQVLLGKELQYELSVISRGLFTIKHLLPRERGHDRIRADGSGVGDHWIRERD